MEKPLCLLSLLVLLLLLTPGCLEKREVIPADREKLASYQSGDSNGDGVADWHQFFFQPYNVSPTMSITRSILAVGVITPSGAAVFTSDSYSLDPAKLAEARVLLKTFNDSRYAPTGRGPAETACLQAAGVAQNPCANLSGCRASCSASSDCTQKLAVYGDALLYSIISFKSNSDSLGSELSSLNAELSESQQQRPLSELNEISQSFERARAFAASLSASQLSDQNAFGLCAPVPVNMNLLGDARKNFILSVQAREEAAAPQAKPPEKYDVLVRLVIDLKQGAAFSDLSLTEIISSELAQDLSNIDFGLNYSEINDRPPFVVTWRQSNVGGSAGSREIAYFIRGAKEPAEGWSEFAKFVSKPTLAITRLDPSASPLLLSARGAYSGVLSLFISFSNFYVAVAIVFTVGLIIVWLLYGVFSFILALVNAVRTRKELNEAVYSFAGHGGTQTTAYAALGVGLTLLGLLAIYLTAPPAVQPTASSDVVQALSADFPKTMGVLSLFLGFMSLYFLLADFAKGAVLGKRYYERPLPTGVRAIMYEAQVLESAKGMRDTLESLLDRTRAPKKQGFVFDLEEKSARTVLASLDAAESASKAANLAQANIEIQKAKASFGKTRVALEEKLEAQQRLSSALQELEKIEARLADAVSSSEKIGADVSKEEKLLAKSPASEAIERARKAWSADDLASAEKIIEERATEFEHSLASLSGKTEERKGLLERTFRCPECGRSISVANAKCQYCKSDVASKIREKASKLEKTISLERKELEPASELIDFSPEEKTLSEIEETFPEILEAAAKKSFDESTRLLEAGLSRHSKLEPLLKDKLEAFNGFTERKELLDKRIAVISHMFEDAQKLSLGISPEQKLFREIDLKSALAEAQTLFRKEKFVQADELLTSTENKFEKLEAELGDAIEDFRNQSDKIAQANVQLSKAEDEIAEAKKLSLDVSSEQKQLASLDLESVHEDLKKREATPAQVDRAAARASDLLKSVERKLSMFSSMDKKISALEKEFREAEALMVKAIAENIDVGEEHEELYSVSLPRLRDEAASAADPEGAQASISKAASSIESASAGLSEKFASLANWNAWSTSIASLLRRQDKITEGMLASIPAKWRKWSMERYLAEHPAESFIMQENALVRLKTAPVSKFQFQSILQSLVASQKIIAAAVVRRDGLMIASNLPTKIDSNTIAAMAAKIATKSEMVSAELKRGMVKDVIIATKEGKLVMQSAGRTAILITLIKPEEDMGFVMISMSNAAKEISSLLEGKA